MSFAGGGTDLPAHYLRHGGAVVSTSVDKYINICVNARFNKQLRASYSITEICDHLEQLKHPLVRECLRLVGITEGIEVVSLADIPANGTGLGSSSSFTVGLLHALYAYLGHRPTKHQLGCESCRIELDICKEPIGKQDQYAAAFGGMNFIKFNIDNTVEVEPLDFHEHIRDRIESCILPFYTGITRSASRLLKAQNEVIETGSRTNVLCQMTEQAYELRDELRRGNADAIGTIMHKGWQLKKSIAKEISSSVIDDWYQKGLDAGALGGKLLGAGAGGFLLFYAAPERHDGIKKALSELSFVPFRLDREGSKIVFRE
nr:hypothetical protein [Rhizomicrobium palustre]